MRNGEMSIYFDKLPIPLSKNETLELLKMKNTDTTAINKLIVHNIRLVIYEVSNRFKLTNYDKDDLISAGNIGLIKAVNTFDLSRGVQFSTYAIKCIDNEILMFIKRMNKGGVMTSLNDVIVDNDSENSIRIEDVISGDIDIELEYIDKETYRILTEIIEKLEYQEKKIVLLQFGFINNKRYTQKQIAEMLNISQSYVSRLTMKTLEKIKLQLKKQNTFGIISNNLVNVKNKQKEKI